MDATGELLHVDTTLSKSKLDVILDVTGISILFVHCFLEPYIAKSMENSKNINKKRKENP